MTTIPARLARLTQSSPTWDVARQRSRSLYRMWYRSAPEICQLYALNIPAHAIRAKVREEFEKNRHVDDIKAVDVLLLKGYQEYQETLNCWKMDSHLMRWFANEEVRLRLSLSLSLLCLQPGSPHLPPRTQLPREYGLSTSKSTRAQRLTKSYVPARSTTGRLPRSLLPLARRLERGPGDCLNNHHIPFLPRLSFLTRSLPR